MMYSSVCTCVLCRAVRTKLFLVYLSVQVNYLVSQLETDGTKVPYRQVAENTDTLRKQLYFLPGYPSI